ncbi:hypothetical protein BKA24_001745 [Microbacterium marinum]|uniref:Uncharacterized protein n=1 Tax=Microbacterium marinum TaxID=421115 RepID=A0A7W7BSG5_9MICO|nr:hypothetical protein [Microbacterium marinum]MBB4667036.1 hypothetical protein [Microbacterium marinum]
MSTTARKLRKKLHRLAGYSAETRFQKKPKVATPVALRSFVTAPVFRNAGDALPTESLRALVPGLGTSRASKRIVHFINNGGRKG